MSKPPLDSDDTFGFGFWDVEGVPVMITRTPEGGASIHAVNDDGTLRPFPLGSVYRNGMPVTRERFIELFPFALEAVELVENS